MCKSSLRFWFVFRWLVMLNIFLYAYWSSICLLWKNTYSDFLPIFKIGLKNCSLYEFFVYFGFSSIQSLSRVWLSVTPWTAEHQASITNSQSLSKLMSIELVMPSNHLILCHPLLLLPSILLNIRVFSNESALRIRWPKHWSFSFTISPSNE